MKRILISLVMIATVGGIAIAGSRAFFSDTETSTGNVLSAGSVDLKVDSSAHYAGLICTLSNSGSSWQLEDPQTPSTRPELVGQPCQGTWASTDLTNQKFFSISDIKPGDEGENTLSMTVVDNDAYACMHIGNVVNAENELLDPEAEAGDDSTAVGELAENLYFTAWLDQGTTPGWQCPVSTASCELDPEEGDNKWQGLTSEPLMFSNEAGPASDVLNGKVYALAASNVNGGAVLTGNQTNYIGLQWCAGQMTISGSTISCDGSTMGNEVQSDSLTADLTLYAVQSRNNANFVCSDNLFPPPVVSP